MISEKDKWRRGNNNGGEKEEIKTNHYLMKIQEIKMNSIGLKTHTHTHTHKSTVFQIRSTVTMCRLIYLRVLYVNILLFGNTHTHPPKNRCILYNSWNLTATVLSALINQRDTLLYTVQYLCTVV